MQKIGIVVCGNSGIDYIDHEYDIPVIRSILLMRGEEYTDFVDISAEDFYKSLNEDDKLIASTSQASTGEMLEIYEAAKAKGYEQLLVISISQKLSGTYENATLAANMMGEYKVTVFNSLTLSYPQAKMALEAAKMAKEDKSLEEIIEHMEYIRDNHTIWFAVDTLKYLVANGRLSGASGFVGSLLKLKPLLQVSKEGTIDSVEKIRTTYKAANKVVENFLAETEGKDVEPFIIHSHAPERVARVRKMVMDARPDIKEIKDYPLTPVVGAHAGPNIVAMGYIINK
ncbi:MAG: DegV domain-containing protein [Candidatus Izimaplasma bacterium HR2]|nr:MAG: DegV domain-containing protein [Candidatus Izimaplasma bacterium HR2]